MSSESRIGVLRVMEQQLGEGAWAIALDTNQIGGPPSTDPDGFQFDRLGVLRGLHEAGIAVLTTSVWQLEALRHLHLTLEERRQLLKDAAFRMGLFGVPPFVGLAAAIKADLSRLPNAEAVWESFRVSVGMTPVAVTDGDAAATLRLYEAKEPPFESQKKEEFPDALSLIALRRHAEEHNLHIAVVTNDNGCLNFCKGTDRLHGFATVEGAQGALAQRADVLDRVARSADARLLLTDEKVLERLKWAFFMAFDTPADFGERPRLRQIAVPCNLVQCITERLEIDLESIWVTWFNAAAIGIRCRVRGSFRLERRPFSYDEGGQPWTTSLWADVDLDEVLELQVNHEFLAAPEVSIRSELKILAPRYLPEVPEWTLVHQG